jgi:glycosyltransferase involved in cell wall biosynthesis
MTSSSARGRDSDYVFFGTAAWDSPWLTEHNLAHALAARGRRVLFVEPPITPLTPIRHGLRRETLALTRRLLRGGVRRSGRIHVLQPLTLPPIESARARRLAVPFVRSQIRRAVRRAGLQEPVVVAARWIVPFRGAAGERATVYLVKDLVEAGAALIGREASAIARDERQMLEQADLVCAVTPRLCATLAAAGIEAELLPHGFHAELAPLYDAAERPAELEGLGKPVLGYAGRIDGRLDFDALGALADHYRDGSVVLIGPVSPRLPRQALEQFARRPNVHLLGSRSREALPSYLSHLDCCLMPYREDEWGAHGSPLKLWDYLYAGPPVVGSGYAALADQPLVHYASPPSRLPETVADALAENGSRRDLRRAQALENSWVRRAEALEDLVRAGHCNTA